MASPPIAAVVMVLQRMNSPRVMGGEPTVVHTTPDPAAFTKASNPIGDGMRRM
jgi:hypothetical protein